MTWTWLGFAALGILAICFLIGYHRGFIKEVVSMFFVVLSVAVVWAVNPYINEFVKENTPVYKMVQEGFQSLVESQTGSEKTEGLNRTEQQEVIDRLSLPDLLKDGLEKNNTAQVYQYLAVRTFGEYISGYLALMAVNGISFLISFLLATILIRMIAYALDILSKLPVINGVNKIAGAFLGGAKGILIIWIVFLILTVFCNTGWGRTGLDLIEKDHVLNWLYERDVFVRIFMNIFYGNA